MRLVEKSLWRALSCKESGPRILAGLVLALGVLTLNGKESAAGIIAIDWDRTANCGLNAFDPDPCPGFCRCLENSISSGDTLCNGSRRTISSSDWAEIIADCMEEGAFADGNVPVIYPPGFNGCPDMRWPTCSTSSCRIGILCEMGDAQFIDNHCPYNGSASCPYGGSINCGNPGNASACGGGGE